ncbi:Fc receptor-like protein 5 [Mobula hypostoma]|uniref:Fc receptor-like protein 5 n=1 Tax=Mobula hypostoma TaxID=723540 RepID=UPI002FC2FCD4
MKRTYFLLIFLQNALSMAPHDHKVTLRLEIQPRAAFTGERVVLKCLWSDLNPDPSVPYRWYKNNQFWKLTYHNTYVINSAKLSDAARYRCEFNSHQWKWVSQDENVVVTGGKIALEVDRSSVFEGETLQLTCRCKNPRRRYQVKFAKNWILFHSLTGVNKITVHRMKVNGFQDSGYYRCIIDSKHSNAVDVVVHELFSKPVLRIEQAPEILEGERLTLDCFVRTINSNFPLQYAFYKDIETLNAISEHREMHFGTVTPENSGTYFCEASSVVLDVRKRSDKVSVSVRELFSKPLLRIDHALEFLEGELLTLDCFVETILYDVPLHYTFHKDFRVLNANSEFHEMYIGALRLENSGSYFCEASSQQLDVRKTSEEVFISVRELFSKPILEADYEAEIFEGDSLMLTCFVQMNSSNALLQYTFYKDDEALEGASDINQIWMETVSLQDSGTYYCEANTLTQAVVKSSNEVFISVNQSFSKPTLRAESETQLFEGQILKLVCQVEVFRPVTLAFAFYKDGAALNYFYDENFYVSRVSWLDDSGIYQCQVTALRGVVKMMSDQLSISVRGIPVSKPVLTMSPTKELMEGGTALLNCTVTNGSKPITYIFLKDGEKELYREESNQTEIPYEIVNVNKILEGNYSCVVENAASELRLYSDFIKITVTVQSPATRISLSTLSCLLVTALIGLYFLRRRSKNQICTGEPASASQSQRMNAGNGSQPNNDETTSNNLEYAVVGIARDSDFIELSAGVVYSECIIKEQSDYANTREVSREKRNNVVSPSDYSVVYAAVNHMKMGAGLERSDTDEPDSSETNFYENFARK